MLAVWTKAEESDPRFGVLGIYLVPDISRQYVVIGFAHPCRRPLIDHTRILSDGV